MESIAHIKPAMKEILDFISPSDILQLEVANRLLFKSVRTTAVEILVNVSIKLYDFESMDQVLFYLKFLTARISLSLPPLSFSLYLNSNVLRSELLEFQKSFLVALDDLVYQLSLHSNKITRLTLAFLIQHDNKFSAKVSEVCMRLLLAAEPQMVE